MKKISIFLCVTMFIAFAAPFTANATTQQSAVEWCYQQLGKQIEFVNTSSPNTTYSCMDFIAEYAKYCGFIGIFGDGIGNARKLSSYEPG